MNRKVLLLMLMVFIMAFTLTGCLPGDTRFTNENPAGFFWGIWHGWLAPFSLILGLFNDATRVYEPNNAGWWYDFGLYIAIISGFGGLRLTRKKGKNKD